MNKLYTLCNNIIKKKKESRGFLPRRYCKQTGLLVLFRDIIFLAVPLLLSLSQELDSNLETLTTAFEKATSEKLRFQEEVNRTNKTIELANRLVKGLEVGTAATNGRSV